MKNLIKFEIVKIAKAAKQACLSLAGVSSQAKKDCIMAMARGLLDNKEFIILQNRKDLAKARQEAKGNAFIDRLTLDEARIKKMADSLNSIAAINDPIGTVLKAWSVPSGLKIKKVRVPIGVIAIIYESRPDVTSDCVGLALKSSNALILRGGSGALYSNIAIFNILKEGIKKHNIPEAAFHLVENRDRKAIDYLLKLDDLIDLVIPRGGQGLIKEVVKKSRIPVIKHYKGICTVYVDEHANIDMASLICLNAKLQRPGVCNAMETLLVHRNIANRFLPHILKAFQEAGVEIRGDSRVRKFSPAVKKAKKSDFQTEFLGLILAVGVVKTCDEAIGHINEFGSHHSDAIITQSEEEADKFLQGVDSACVFLNTSTRFSDGYQFGMGAEMGISTDKIHARGPMAVEELTIYKYQIYGSGQVRE